MPAGGSSPETNVKPGQSRSRRQQSLAGARNPLAGPRPEPNLQYGKGKALQVKAWLRQMPPESALEELPVEDILDDVDSEPLSPGTAASPCLNRTAEDCPQVDTSRSTDSVATGSPAQPPRHDAVRSSLRSSGREQQRPRSPAAGGPSTSAAARASAAVQHDQDTRQQGAPTRDYHYANGGGSAMYRISLDIDELSDLASTRQSTSLRRISEYELPAKHQAEPIRPVREVSPPRSPPKPLDFVLDPSDTAPAPGVAIAAGLHLAQAEARLPPGASTEAKLREALCAAVAAKQQQADAARRDLEATRRQAREVERLADEKARESERQEELQRHRATRAEADLAKAQAAVKEAEGEHRRKAAAAQDREETLRERVENLQEDLDGFVEHSKKTSEDADKAIAAAKKEAAESRRTSEALADKLSEARAQGSSDRAVLQKKVASSASELRSLRETVEGLQAQLDKALKGWEDEAVARTAAEESEARALEAIKAHAEVAARIQRKQEEKESLSNRMAAAGKVKAAAAGAAGGSPGKQQANRKQDQHQDADASPGAEEETAALAAERTQVHPAIQGAIKSGKRELRRAEEELKVARHHAAQKEESVSREAMASAPGFLRSLRLAFRVYVIAHDASDGSVTGNLFGLLSRTHRSFVDPRAQQQTGAAQPDNGAPAASLDAQLVSLAHTVVLMAAPGALAAPRCRAELIQALRFGRRLVVVSEPSATLDGLTAGGEPLAQEAAAALERAWPSRVVLSAAAPEAAAEEVAASLGLPDAALADIPHETLELLLLPGTAAPGLGRRQGATGEDWPLPDLAHLNTPGLKLLRLEVNGSSGTTISHVAALLRGNYTLQKLVLRGARHGDLPELASALIGPGSSSALQGVALGAGAELPLPPLRPSSSSSGSGGALRVPPEPQLRPLDAALLAQLLTAATALRELKLGPAPLLKAKDIKPLAEAAAAHPSLSLVNGLMLRTPRPAPGEGVLDLTPSGAIDLAGAPLGVLGGLLLAQDIERRPQGSISRVDVTGCGLEASGFACVAAALLPACSHVEELSVAGNAATAAGAAALFEALPSLGSLTHLDLGSNALGCEGARALGRRLRGGSGAAAVLRRLVLTGNGIKAAGAQSLAAAVRSCGALRELHLQGNHIGDDGARSIAGALQEPGCALELLDLSDNYSIGREGCKHLAAALSATAGCPLLTLSLSNNHVGEPGAAALAGGLRSNTTLIALRLGQCRLKAQGIAHLSDCLAHNTALQELDIPRNSGGDHAVFALCPVLAKQNHTLRALDLGSNAITASGAKGLREMLKDNTALSELRLGDNTMDAETCREVEALAGARRSGKRPSLPGASLANARARPPGQPPAQQQPRSNENKASAADDDGAAPRDEGTFALKDLGNAMRGGGSGSRRLHHVQSGNSRIPQGPPPPPDEGSTRSPPKTYSQPVASAASGKISPVRPGRPGEVVMMAPDDDSDDDTEQQQQQLYSGRGLRVLPHDEQEPLGAAAPGRPKTLGLNLAYSSPVKRGDPEW